MAADINGDELADIIGFGVAGTYIALAEERGGFGVPTLAARAFGASADAGGWANANQLPRMVADVNGDGLADLIGFGYAGVYVMPGADLVPIILPLSTDLVGSDLGTASRRLDAAPPRLPPVRVVGLDMRVDEPARRRRVEQRVIGLRGDA